MFLFRKYHGKRKFKHFSFEDLVKIEFLLQNNKSIRFIAKQLNVSPSTVSREIKRNLNEYGIYEANLAITKRQKDIIIGIIFRFVELGKYEEFSKIFAVKYDKKVHGVKATYFYIAENFPNIERPSLKTVFNWIKTNKWVIVRSDRLRQYYKKGGKRTRNVVQRLVPSGYVKPIWARDKSIDSRQDFGHWELDLVVGKKVSGHDSILTLVERKTRKLFAKKYEIKIPESSIKPSKILQMKIIYISKQSLATMDLNLSKIALLAYWLKIIVYKAEPYASFQRGSNEHANGLIRRFYPKGFDFNLISDDDLQNTISKINSMPREIFNWKSALEVFNDNLVI
ncbi:IS30 family transposase [Mesomycoplasma ovipneumoniae]|uniref:IS30 family transposase n=1 Tax=Mesomycoplasma ovipneumoniae TaxID=29562 RepID=UPI0028B0C091|nr:IS30 family transposase [Mesomycoplasma ovipneumoniae]WNM13848.1 IS30 family transposase [Mesomycoplasma ovipneumoniae]